LLRIHPFVIIGASKLAGFIQFMKDTKDRKFLERKYSVEESAAILGIHPVSVRRIIAEGTMGAYRFRDRVLVGESHLEDYIRRCERNPRCELSVVEGETACPSGLLKR
jgi:excisionase family DNA binding protein